VGDEFFYSEGRPDQSRELFDQVALSDEFSDFLTLPAYEVLE
jgi:malate synthase